MENKRIPFDWEKYQSGEFEAVCRNGIKPIIGSFNPNAVKNNKIVFWVDGKAYTRNENGLVSDDGFTDGQDLFLITEPKKLQAWVNLYSNGQAVTWNNEPIAIQQQKSFESESVKFVKTILIEWEG